MTSSQYLLLPINYGLLSITLFKLVARQNLGAKPSLEEYVFVTVFAKKASCNTF